MEVEKYQEQQKLLELLELLWDFLVHPGSTSKGTIVCQTTISLNLKSLYSVQNVI